MRPGNLCQRLVVHVVSAQRRSQIIEVPDHRRGKVEVELPASNTPDSEPMPSALRDEDERPSRTGELAVFEIHDVFALEDIERLSRVVMYMKRWPESGWFVRLQHGYDTGRFFGVGLERHPELAQVDEPSFARADDERPMIIRHGGRGCHAAISPSTSRP